jgi:uncharacterized paraquat-inducible protein A
MKHCRVCAYAYNHAHAMKCARCKAALRLKVVMALGSLRIATK